jgi:hypothetical protein
MTDQIRFHLDENVDPAVAQGLRRRGVEVTTSHDAGLFQAGDLQQIDFAMAKRRTVITHDEDFLAIAASQVPHPGIAYCHQDSRSIGQIIAGLMLIRDCMTPEDMLNHVEFL